MGIVTEFIQEAEKAFPVLRHHQRKAFNMPAKWVLVGEGWYSRVYMHIDFMEYVLKISGPSYFGHASHGNVVASHRNYDAWPVFARHCQAHPHEHLPEILAFRQVSRSMSWGVMPRYVSIHCSAADTAIDPRDHLRLALEDLVPALDWEIPLLQMQQELGYAVDLHDGNVMWDGQNIRIVDPFSFGGSYVHK